MALQQRQSPRRQVARLRPRSAHAPGPHRTPAPPRTPHDSPCSAPCILRVPAVPRSPYVLVIHVPPPRPRARGRFASKIPLRSLCAARFPSAMLFIPLVSAGPGRTGARVVGTAVAAWRCASEDAGGRRDRQEHGWRRGRGAYCGSNQCRYPPSHVRVVARQRAVDDRTETCHCGRRRRRHASSVVSSRRPIAAPAHRTV